MSLAQITEKIRSDATHEAEEIIAKANAQAAYIMQRAEEENDSVRSSYASRTKAEEPEVFRRREIVANLDAKKLMLQAQRDVINDVFAMTLEKLEKLEKDAYLDFCAALLDGAVSTKEETIRVGFGEKYIDNAWIEVYNQKHGAKLSLSDERSDFSGGFILENGKICVNYSWNMLIQIAQEKFEADVIERLFPPAD